MIESVDGFAEQKLSTIAASHDAGGTLRHPERAWSAESLGELEFLFCEAVRRHAIAEREMGERGL